MLRKTQAKIIKRVSFLLKPFFEEGNLASTILSVLTWYQDKPICELEFDLAEIRLQIQEVVYLCD